VCAWSGARSLCYEIAKPENVRCPGGNDASHVVICPDSYQRARAFLDKVNANTEGKIDCTNEIQVKPENISSPVDRIYGFILDAGPDGVQRQEVTIKFKGWKAAFISECIQKLVELERVKIVDVMTKGRTAQKFVGLQMPSTPETHKD
jgi:hypothetical protein